MLNLENYCLFKLADLELELLREIKLKGPGRKNERGYRLKANHFSSIDRDQWKLYLMVISGESDIKLCKYIRKFIYMQQNSHKWECRILVTCLCLYHVTSILHYYQHGYPWLSVGVWWHHTTGSRSTFEFPSQVNLFGPSLYCVAWTIG